MLELVYGEAIWASSAGVTRIADGTSDNVRAKWRCRGVERVGAFEVTLNQAGVGVGAVGNNAGELSVEGLGDVTVAGGGCATKEDGLIWGRVGRLVVQLPDEGEELGGVLFVGAGFDAIDPGSLLGLVNVLLDLLVEEWEPGVGRGVGTDGVAFPDKAFGGV